MKSFKPTSNGRRQMTVIPYRKYLTASEPWKPLTSGGKRSVGRNSQGRITTRHKGGGHKRLFREIDFVYDKFDIPAKIETVEYDPSRTAFIALVVYRDGVRRYVVVPHTMRPGDVFTVSEKALPKTGNRLPLREIPVGTFVFNIEVQPKGGAKMVRSAGTYAEVMANDSGYTNIRLPSGEVRKVNQECWATIGTVSNIDSNLVNLGKAGRSRWLGIRPTVRGSAQNPVDHPYGGGEGRQGRGTRRAKSVYGKVTGGRKTRRPKKYSNVFRVSRRAK